MEESWAAFVFLLNSTLFAARLISGQGSEFNSVLFRYDGNLLGLVVLLP